jgi:hypothetical protein
MTPAGAAKDNTGIGSNKTTSKAIRALLLTPEPMHLTPSSVLQKKLNFSDLIVKSNRHSYRVICKNSTQQGIIRFLLNAFPSQAREMGLSRGDHKK